MIFEGAPGGKRGGSWSWQCSLFVWQGWFSLIVTFARVAAHPLLFSLSSFSRVAHICVTRTYLRSVRRSFFLPSSTSGCWSQGEADAVAPRRHCTVTRYHVVSVSFKESKKGESKDFAMVCEERGFVVSGGMSRGIVGRGRFISTFSHFSVFRYFVTRNAHASRTSICDLSIIVGYRLLVGEVTLRARMYSLKNTLFEG